MFAEEEIDYFESADYEEQFGSTPLHGYLRLFFGIMYQAQRDRKVEEFRAYWVERPPMPIIWESLLAVSKSEGSPGVPTP